MCHSCGDTDLVSYPSTAIWGPILWMYLHNMATYTPGANINDVVELLSKLEGVIPCDYCKTHYIAYRGKHLLPSPATFENIQGWVNALHTFVASTITKRPLPPFVHNKRVVIPESNWTVFNNQINKAIVTKKMTQTGVFNSAYSLLSMLKNNPQQPTALE